MSARMKLEDFPVEVLNEVTQRLNGHDIASLWFCGSMRLNMKLGKGGGVTYFEGCLRSWRPVVFPRLLASFPHLTTLSLTSELKAEQIEVTGSLYHLIPPTVTALKSSFLGLFGQLEHCAASHPGFLPSLKHLNCIAGSDASHFPLRYFVQRFPNLESLEIKLKTRENLYPSIRTLPRTLTALSAFCYDVKPLGASDWPPNLTSLHLECTGPKWARNFDWMATLPASLRVLHVPNHTFDASAIPWSALPSALERLTLSPLNVGASQISLLPRTLLHLDLRDASLADMETSKVLFKSFPPALTALYLPNTLRSFFVDLPEENLSELASLLPAGLRSFSSEYFGDGNDYDAKFPTSIETISLLKSHGKVPIPPAVTQLNLFDQVSHYAQLPAGLKVLMVYCDKGSGEDEGIPENLPRHLRHLHLVTPLDHSFHTTWRNLPRALDTFECRSSNSARVDVSLTTLPPELYRLQTFHLQGVLISSLDWISSLPRTLTSLRISQLTELTEEHLRRLPTRDLNYLRLDTVRLPANTHFASLLPYLPQRLLLLSVACSSLADQKPAWSLTSEDLAKFPPGLISLFLPVLPPGRATTLLHLQDLTGSLSSSTP